MPEESKESKAKKLAAARKKLKEYQQRGTTASTAATSYPNTDSTSNSGHVSSNVSERSDSELHLNGSTSDINQANVLMPDEVGDHVGNMNVQPEIASYFADSDTSQQIAEANFKSSMFSVPLARSDDINGEAAQSINAIQVLITEKAQLTAELNKYRTQCREKDLELEELRVQHSNISRRVDDLQQHLKDQQKQAEQQRAHNAELQHKLAQARSQNEDQSSHLQELQQQMQLREERLKVLDNDFRDKSSELELAQLRIRQLSDENNISKDNRVESLTQTQFMYEQQIRDLQAMVQQLTQDKEQSNTQFQTYVQQLNAQVNQLNERNAELQDESTKLQERDKQLVDHVQQLEKEIQKNITRQTEIKEAREAEAPVSTITNQQIKDLQDRLQEFETERYEFQLKIKSQEDRLHTMQNEIYQKQQEIIELREHLENITSEQPDKTKLLAAMESDKVAASRALSQNVDLKKQLDELEMRFVQLTNDKADLMNRLDAELYANREMRNNYIKMEERIQTLDDRFKFKDEEMIRLSHENEELKKENTNLQRTLNGEPLLTSKDDEENISHGHDHHDHHEHHEHHHHHDGDEHHHHQHEGDDHHHQQHQHHDHDHDHHHHEHESTHQDCHDGHDLNNLDDTHKHEHQHEHNHDNCEHDVKEKNNDCDVCEEATELIDSVDSKITQTKPLAHGTKNTYHDSPPRIATEEAVEKLQQRFTQLISQVADLTEEKQRLEHLVMQLQSETETIGEYIALYQTQRRILKQREYEKAAQTALLQEEREQMRDRLTMLNNLVTSLGMEIPITQQQYQLQQHLNSALAENAAVSLDNGEDRINGIELQSSSQTQHSPCPSEHNNSGADGSLMPNLNSLESQQILHKIQDIITEIKENTKELPTVQHSADHLNCCSGKFEVV